MLVGVRKRVIELGVGQTARVMSPSKREKGSFAAGELVQRRPVAAQMAFCTLPPLRQRVQT